MLFVLLACQPAADPPAKNRCTPEVPYDGIDNDCDPSTPDDDLDGDGFGVQEDCDDENPDAWPGATEVWYDGVDEACDGGDDEDQDGDGTPRENDCDDTNPRVNPQAEERCSTPVDDNCDGQINEVNAQGCKVRFADGDGDGWGAGPGACVCEGGVPDDTDCDDADPTVNPGAPEICNNGVDDDCSPDGCRMSSMDFSDIPVLSTLPTGYARGVGDLNGDGYEDLLLSVDGWLDQDRLEAHYTMALMEGGPTPTITGNESTFDTLPIALGYDVGVGDLDGDGIGDLLSADPGAGLVYPIPGNPVATSDFLVPASTWTGIAGDLAGYTMDGGDIDGDGLLDVAIGAPGDTQGAPDSSVAAGGVYLVSVAGDLSARDLSKEPLIRGTSDWPIGKVLSVVGDMDGDGYGETALGSWNYCSPPDGVHSGRVYLVHGEATPLSHSILSDLLYTGSEAGDCAGGTVDGGDLNGDGYADLVVGAPAAGNTNAGKTYIVPGGSLLAGGPLEDQIILDSDPVWGGSIADGEAVVVGDLDADGYEDLAISAGLADFGRMGIVGGVFVYWGRSVLSDERMSTGATLYNDYLFSPLTYPYLTKAGDLDADGYSDLVFTYDWHEAYTVFMELGSGE